MSDKVKNFKQFVGDKKEPRYKVFESKYYYSAFKDILFIGNYEDCVRFII